MTAPARLEDALDASPVWRDELGALLRLATPIVLARLGIMVMGLTDAIVVGRFSAKELGYLALGWSPTNIVLASAVGLLSGVQVMTARRVGEGRPELAGVVLRRGLVYALQIGVAATLAIGLGAPPLLQALGMDPDLAAGSGRAARILALSLIPYLLAVALTYHLEALGRTQPGLWGMWAANVANLGFNLLLAPGAFGLPALGAVGAGYATLAARSLLLLWLVVAVARAPQTKGYRLWRRPVREPGAEAEQRRVGYGAGVSVFAEVAAFTGMNVVAAWLSPLAVAAWAVCLNITALIFMVPLGLAAAAAVRVGRAYGAKDGRGVFRSAVVAVAVAAIVAGGVALIIAVNAGSVAGFYAADPALKAAAGGALALATIFFIPDAIQAVVANVQRARADVLVPTIIHIGCYAGVMLPLGWFLAHRAHLGLAGIVWAVIAASFVVAILLLSRLATTTVRDRRGSEAQSV